MEIISGGVTAAKGFSAAATAAGIKYQNRTDMAMIYSDTPCVTAGVFTSNIVKAAPVLWDKNIVDGGSPTRAVIINSGIANACTGKEGMDCCKAVAGETASALGISENEVLIASTGVIGRLLPVDKLRSGVISLSKGLGSDLSFGTAAEHAIMTTDTVPKECAVRFTVGGKTVTMGGMCKGSGMIHPNMCTMLAFITTDLAISKELLQSALSEVVCDTFNMVSVDGDTSTNDTLIVMANGTGGNEEITSRGEDYAVFKEALFTLCEIFAKKIASDGEGCTALLEVKVINAPDKETAKTLAKSVISSNLTKAAVFGHDANWGRVLCAMGYSGAAFDPEKVTLSFESAAGSVTVAKGGLEAEYSEELATKILSESEVTVIADLNAGTENATAWGCDLTFDYVKINADYRS